LEKRLKVAVNCRFLIKDKLEGYGHFTQETLKRITRSNLEVDFYFLFDRSFDDSFVFSPNIEPIILFPPARHPFLWFIYFEIETARVLRKIRPDLYLSFDGYACLNSSIPQVMVVHDLAFEHFSDNVNWLTHKYLKYFVPRFCKKVDRIVTVSEFSKSDIVKQYNVNPNKIDVVYNGTRDGFEPVEENTKKEVRTTYASGVEYFLYVGSVHPRKNLENLLSAFTIYKEKTGSDKKLLIAGRMAWKTSPVLALYEKMAYKDDVVFTGYVSDDEITKITASAFALCYVSLFEGFGIPIIEGMRCSVPVITSNTSSMPEVAGQAALIVNPENVDEISQAMIKLDQDKSLHSYFAEEGFERQKVFSWERTARNLWKSCLKVVKVPVNT